MKRILMAISAILCGIHAFSQEASAILKNEDRLITELKKDKYDIDSNAQAVILYEEGFVDFEDASYTFKYEVIAKILNDDAVEDLAEVAIQKRDNTDIINITAEAYNLTNGVIQVSKLGNENILKDQVDKNLKVFKFNIPNVKKGSIIHYTYKLRKNSSFNLPEWTFQNTYPTLRSKYSLKLPITVSFNKILRSSKNFIEITNSNELESCDACEFAQKYETTGFYTAWSIKDVPAFQAEPFSSSKNNFLERIKVIITKFYQSSGDQIKLFNTWTDFSKKYMYDDDDYIGQVFKSNGFLDETVNEVIKNKNTNLDKAHAIFNYVKSNYAFVENNDVNIKSVYKNKKGDIFGINMLLVAMLKHANLNCEPVVLSTKENERLNSQYPSPYVINYLIADFKDQGKQYFLDATKSNLPFGILKPECYNGYARLVNKTGDTLSLSPDDIKDKTTTIIDIEPNQKPNELLVKVEQKLGTFRSLYLRDASKGDINDANKRIIESLGESNQKVNESSIQLKNFDNPDEPVSIHFEKIIKLDSEASTLYMNPYFFKFYEKNPFTSLLRSLPIEMDYKEDLTYILNLKLPQGYTVDDYPKSTSVILGAEGSIQFSNKLNYDTSGNTFSLYSKFQTVKTVFPAGEYINIREIFQRMITEQSKKIVIKKG